MHPLAFSNYWRDGNLGFSINAEHRLCVPNMPGLLTSAKGFAKIAAIGRYVPWPLRSAIPRHNRESSGRKVPRNSKRTTAGKPQLR